MRKNTLVAGIFLSVTIFGLVPYAHADDPVPTITVPVVSVPSGYQLYDWASSDYKTPESEIILGSVNISQGAGTEESASSIGSGLVQQVASRSSGDDIGRGYIVTGGETSGKWIWQGTTPPDVNLIFGYQATSSLTYDDSSECGAMFIGHSKNSINGPGSYDQTYGIQNYKGWDPMSLNQVDVHHQGSSGTIEFYLSTTLDASSWAFGGTAVVNAGGQDQMDISPVP